MRAALVVAEMALAVVLLIGAGLGSVIGAGGGWLLKQARRRGFAAEEFTGIAVLALALLAYAVAVSVSGNGFVSAFCGGLAFGAWPEVWGSGLQLVVNIVGMAMAGWVTLALQRAVWSRVPAPRRSHARLSRHIHAEPPPPR